MEEALRNRDSVRALTIVAFIVGAFAIFAGLGRLSLMQPDEERNAEVAREMERSGSWLIPTYDGLPYLDKPAFFFKSVGLSFRLFGESNAAARLPSAVFGFGLLAMLYVFCRRSYDPQAAALAVLVVGTSPLYLAFCRLVIFDMMLSFFLCGAVFAGYLAEEREGRATRGWYLVGAISSAFATLVKGPVGFVVPLLVLGIFNWTDGRRGAWKRLFAPINIVAFFAITLPWFLGVVHEYRDFAHYGLVEETFRRYTTTAFRRTGPIYYYLPWVFGGCFAWSVLLPESMIRAWHSRTRWTRADRLFIVWSVTALVFFSISRSKRPDYILTVVVALGALVARVFALAIGGRNPQAMRTVLRGTTGLAGVSALAAGFLGAAILKPELVSWLARNRSGEFGRLGPVYVPALGVSLATVVLATIARWRGDARLALATFAVLPCAVLLAGRDGLQRYAESKSTRALAERISSLPAQAEVACLECFPTGLPFYLKRPVTVVSTDGRELTSNYILFMLTKSAVMPKPLVPVREFDRWLGGQDRPVYLISGKNGRATLDAVATRRGVAVTELAPGWWGALLPASKEV
ncbi:MAG TPA: glycosyltransferase family 39 protein [Verrucomicrobiae bacterium]|nr:glycosyltransferase family 39 protein [Verrucomicrobiae bacterium]